jgi:hypothetical protein
MCAEQSSVELAGEAVKCQVPSTETVQPSCTCRSEPDDVADDQDVGASGKQRNRP